MEQQRVQVNGLAVCEPVAFLNEKTTEITEHSETLVRRLIEKITVYDEKLTVEFKSGIEIYADA